MIDNKIMYFLGILIFALLGSCCSKKCISDYVELDDTFCGKIYMIPHDDGSYGAITLIDPGSQDIKGYFFNSESIISEIGLRDLVSFKLKQSKDFSLAFQIEKTDNCQLTTFQLDQLKSFTKVDFHNKFNHTGGDSHYRGHIDNRINKKLEIQGYNSRFDLTKIISDTERIVYIPSTFSEFGCINPDSVFVAKSGNLHTDGNEIITEIACTHLELHN